MASVARKCTISKIMLLAAAGITALAGGIVLGQQRPTQTQAPPNHARPVDAPKWEAVSIKPCGPSGAEEGQRGGETSGSPIRFSPDRMTLRCLTVRSLIQSAYKTYLDDPSLSGPPAT